MLISFTASITIYGSVGSLFTKKMRIVVFIVSALTLISVFANAQSISDPKKLERRNEVIQKVISRARPNNHTHHSVVGPALFACAMEKGLGKRRADLFVGSARKVGFRGDVVIGVHPEASPHLISALKEHRSIIYTYAIECEGDSLNQLCRFQGSKNLKVPLKMLRYNMFVWWASRYSSDAVILVADFGDTFFQSNPFLYRSWEWQPPQHQLVLFQENFPLQYIYRNNRQAGWIEMCYGMEGRRAVGGNMIINGGSALGSRDGIIIYSALINRQLDKKIRHAGRTVSFHNASQADQCIKQGVEQAFSNWLVHTGELDRYVDIRIYPQGEGPVNVIGAFGFPTAIVKRSLADWGVLRGIGDAKAIYNWNGEPSPVVYQYEQYLANEFSPSLKTHFKNLV